MTRLARDRTFRSRDGLRLYYRDYPGPGDRVPVLCLHGLTRSSRDFADLAPHLAATRRVLCGDVRGRGRSEWDPKPERYAPATYVEDVAELLRDAEVPQVVVIGTSMGGILAMGLAASHPGALVGVVLNDIGPVVDPRGLERIAGYVGKSEPVSSWAEATRAAQTVHGHAFPDYGPADWERFARRTLREAPDGRLVADYDPAIAQGLARGTAAPADLWPLFEPLARVPVLVLRGALSDILSSATLAQMAERHPTLTSVEVPDRGHAPALDEPECLRAIDAFLGSLP
ncbi:MAG: alpha/beta fold hydrolase [Myxococcota bacterium]